MGAGALRSHSTWSRAARTLRLRLLQSLSSGSASPGCQSLLDAVAWLGSSLSSDTKSSRIGRTGTARRGRPPRPRASPCGSSPAAAATAGSGVGVAPLSGAAARVTSVADGSAAVGWAVSAPTGGEGSGGAAAGITPAAGVIAAVSSVVSVPTGWAGAGSAAADVTSVAGGGAAVGCGGSAPAVWSDAGVTAFNITPMAGGGASGGCAVYAPTGARAGVSQTAASAEGAVSCTSVALTVHASGQLSMICGVNDSPFLPAVGASTCATEYPFGGEEGGGVHVQNDSI